MWARCLCNTLFLLLAVAALTNADDVPPSKPPPTLTADPAPTGTTTPVPSCVPKCFSKAAKQVGCDSFSDTECVCASLRFASLASSCFAMSCHPSDIVEADALLVDACGRGPGSGPASDPIFPTKTVISHTGNPSWTASPPVASESDKHSSGAAVPSAPAPSTTSDSALPGQTAPQTENPSEDPKAGAHPTVAPGGSVQSDTASGGVGTVNITITSTAGSASTALTPPANGAASARLGAYSRESTTLRLWLALVAATAFLS